MDERRVWFEPDLVARIELMTLAKNGNHLMATELGEVLGFRASRLDHDYFGLGAVVGDGEMLGPDTVHGRPSFGIGRRRLQRQFDAVRPLEARTAVRLHRP